MRNILYCLIVTGITLVVFSCAKKREIAAVIGTDTLSTTALTSIMPDTAGFVKRKPVTILLKLMAKQAPAPSDRSFH